VIAPETCDWLVKVVWRGPPFQVTTSPAAKLMPVTLSVKAWPLRLALVGETDEIAGPFGWVATIVNVEAEDVPPPGGGFTTVICAKPMLATSDAKIETASWPVLMLRLLERGRPFQYAKDTPFELAIKPVPVMKIVKFWLPTVMFEGKRPVIIGVALKGGVLLLQPATMTTNPPSNTRAAHRESFKRFLLSMSFNGIPQPLGTGSPKNEARDTEIAC